MKKRLLSVLLIICLCAALLPSVALADDGDPIELTEELLNTDDYKYSSLGEYNHFLPKGTYKLVEDITIGYCLYIGSSSESASVVLDLNGHKLERAATGGSLLFIDYKSTLTLTDGSTEKSGNLRSSGGCAISIGREATLCANGGSVYGDINITGSGVVIKRDTTKDGITSFYGDVTSTFSGTEISGGMFYGDIPTGTYAKLSGETVTFMNGEITYAQQVLSSGTTPQKPTEPTKDNHTFGGWYTDEGCTDGNEYTFDTAVTESITLYAKWNPNPHTVTWNANGGTFATGDETKTETLDYNSSITPPKTPTREGYKFVGWYTAADDRGTKVTTFGTATSNVAYYAHWVKDATQITTVYAAYRVEHYLQQDDGSYELQAEDTQFPLYGLVGATAEATPKEYDGYRLNAAKSTSSGEIIKPTKENPEVLTLKLYYDKEFSLGNLIAILDDISFRDVAKSDWFYGDVMSLAEAGVVAGYPDGTFRPNGEVTWGETLKLVAGALGAGDMPSDGSHWASGYLQWAKRNGFVSANASINLDAAMTRGEVADLLAKAMQLTADASAANPFEDAAPASALALYAAGIIAGSLDDGRLLFRAGSTITRAEMATVIWRIYRSGYGGTWIG